MPKNLYGNKRQRAIEVTRVRTEAHKEARQRHCVNHEHNTLTITVPDSDVPKYKKHNHHSHLKTRFVNPTVQFDDRQKLVERGKCYTHEEMRKKKMIGGKRRPKTYTRKPLTLLDAALTHPQSLHDALSKLANENKGINVSINIF